MFLDYHAVLVFLITGVAMVSAPLILGFLFRPSNPYPEKNMAYECAEDPIGPAQIRFDMRFYTTALIFIIFEVEIALMFPWARVFRDAPNQTLALGGGTHLHVHCVPRVGCGLGQGRFGLGEDLSQQAPGSGLNWREMTPWAF